MGGDADEISVVVRNLPPDITAEDLEEDLATLGYELQIYIERGGSTHKVTAVVTFDGMTRNTAETIASSISGMRYRDRTLQAYVPLFMQ